MIGKKYESAMTQLEQQGTLHPDVHLPFNQAIEDQLSVVSMIMTQLYLKAGLKTWGDKAKMTMRSEMKQLHMRHTLGSRHWHELSAKEKAEGLEYHMFLNLKRDGKIKGWAVTGVNKQRNFITKEEASIQ